MSIQRVLGPLGLRRTTWAARRPSRRATSSIRGRTRRSREPVGRGRATASAGELWSTAPDLCRWAAFLADPDDEVLAPDTVEEMHAFQTMTDLDRWTLGHGLALMLMRKGDRVFSGHSGAHLGYLSNVACHRPTRTGAAVVTNSSAGVAITDARRGPRGRRRGRVPGRPSGLASGRAAAGGAGRRARPMVLRGHRAPLPLSGRAAGGAPTRRVPGSCGDAVRARGRRPVPRHGRAGTRRAASASSGTPAVRS